MSSIPINAKTFQDYLRVTRIGDGSTGLTLAGLAIYLQQLKDTHPRGHFYVQCIVVTSVIMVIQVVLLGLTLWVGYLSPNGGDKTHVGDEQNLIAHSNDANGGPNPVATAKQSARNYIAATDAAVVAAQMPALAGPPAPVLATPFPLPSTPAVLAARQLAVTIRGLGGYVPDKWQLLAEYLIRVIDGQGAAAAVPYQDGVLSGCPAPYPATPLTGESAAFFSQEFHFLRLLANTLQSEGGVAAFNDTLLHAPDAVFTNVNVHAYFGAAPPAAAARVSAGFVERLVHAHNDRQVCSLPA